MTLLNVSPLEYLYRCYPELTTRHLKYDAAIYDVPCAMSGLMGSFWHLQATTHPKIKTY